MRVGVDIDEVLTYSVSYFVEHFNQKHNTNYSKDDIIEYDFKSFIDFESKYVVEKFINFLDANLDQFDILKGAKQTLTKLKQNGCKIFILTSRRLSLKEKTINWIENHFGKKFFDGYLFYNKDRSQDICKSKVCLDNNIDVMIEDAPNYIKNIAKKKIKVLMMDNPWNQNIEENEYIIRVRNWSDVDEKLELLN